MDGAEGEIISVWKFYNIHIDKFMCHMGKILLTEYTMLKYFTMNPDFSRSWDSMFCSVRVYRDLQMWKLKDQGCYKKKKIEGVY